ncbi:MAG: AAA family ATPase [Dehalococcoidia bacterium]|jgi:pilus assembly protein CpaE|nr:AAA family ATPase [Dehalococcoidia bacterium]
MAQLTALILGQDEEFRRHVAMLLRAGGVPVGVVDEQAANGSSSTPDLAVIDIRSDTPRGLSTIERVRSGSAAVAIFAIAGASEPELILEAMRAGANEFFTWSRDAGSAPAKAMEESFFGAVRRTAARRDASPANARSQGIVLSFLGAKGGAGTTTLSVNCAVELARLTKKPTLMIDLKASLGEVTLFLGVRPRFGLLDAIDNLHRLDSDFLRELVAKHKSGLEILAGAEQFDRPNGQDAGAIEELLRIVSRSYDYVVIDCGNVVSASTASALYASDTIFLITNPDVPSIRNAQRLLERVRELGAGSERLRVVLNRASEPHLITSKQIESALGLSIHQTFPSDYRTVATALNSGVPLTLTNHSALAAQFDRFTHDIAGGREPAADAGDARRQAFLGLF